MESLLIGSEFQIQAKNSPDYTSIFQPFSNTVAATCYNACPLPTSTAPYLVPGALKEGPALLPASAVVLMIPAFLACADQYVATRAEQCEA